MVKILLSLLSLVLLTTAADAQLVGLVKGMKISRSTKIRPGVYRIPAPAGTERSVILIQGNDIVIDFNNAILDGATAQQLPNKFSGVAVMIRDSRNVTIKNLKGRGYKIALMAKNVEGLVLDSCDLSYNYRERLKSSATKEDLSDWMSYHNNEKDEWLRYGAAIYLRNCNAARVTGCRVTGGQNALMMTECNDGTIGNNDFSYNSGIGLGLYRCSRNKIMYNSFNFNVRGYSHGVYSRGQDSAGILLYEQSNENFIYKNSATHSGDGLFLWAGQTTMDNGQGGCNDNIIMGNDFSYATANGVEVTFSRNVVSDNRLFGCDYGIWGGYSFGSNFSNNKFRDNRIDIAIEHGQDNKISFNIFYDSRQAIRLWAGSKQPDDWGYPKYRDTRSHGYAIAFNNFNKCDTILSAIRTDSINFFGNVYGSYGQLFKTDSTVTNLDTTVNEILERQLSVDTSVVIPAFENPNDPFKGRGLRAGRKNILVTEWGPYDFRSPIIWQTNPVENGDTLRFDILGPAGQWKIKSFRGVGHISAMKGGFPAAMTATRLARTTGDISIELEYAGSAIVTQFGKTVGAARPVQFSFRKGLNNK